MKRHRYSSSTTFIMLSVMATLAGACSSERPSTDNMVLSVELVTDFIPVGELASVRVDVLTDDYADFSQRLSVVIDVDDDLLRGFRLAQVVLPGAGAYQVSLVLLDRTGNALARRQEAAFVVESTTISVIVTRACAGISCPTLSDEADESVCLGGRCVTPECAANAESCADAECTSSSDCVATAACAEGRCVAGACLYSGRVSGTLGACPEGQVCDPETGCDDMPPEYCSDGAERACDLQLGVCSGRYVRCERGVFPACGSVEYGARYQVEETLCDGADNDCDGMTDEMVEITCPLQEGICAGSRRRCGGIQGLLVCDYLAHDPRYEPVEQSCDGVDNDCDGVVDESATPPICPLQDGVCARARARCDSGRWLCDASEYGASFELDETSCDGQDNDCDRRVDEALEPPGCELAVGVCRGSVRRCGGNAGFLACRAADYGALYEVDETRCDGLDNDCDGMVDEGITRACDLGCGTGIEACQNGTFVDCDAPPRTELGALSLGGGTYQWGCVDIPSDATVEFTGDVRVEIERDLMVQGDIEFASHGTLVAARIFVAEDASISGPRLEIVASERIDISALGVVDASGMYSGGGGAACSAASDRAVASGGGGGALGGAGGQGGGCGTFPGLVGGSSVDDGGAEGADGCGCPCLLTAAGGAESGGEGAAAPAGSGGGGGAGGAGGDGAAGRFPDLELSAPGGRGGSASIGAGMPRFGGGGGGGAGADRGNFGQVCGANGGRAGGIISLTAPRIVNSGRIAANGDDGGDSRAWSRVGASGGGGAGAIVISSELLDNRGLISAVGGHGGSQLQHATSLTCRDTDGGGGGGGGGGYVYLDVDGMSSGSLSRISVEGGPGGTIDCSSPVGAPGHSGRVCCTGSITNCAPCAD